MLEVLAAEIILIVLKVADRIKPSQWSSFKQSLLEVQLLKTADTKDVGPAVARFRHLKKLPTKCAISFEPQLQLYCCLRGAFVLFSSV